MLGSVTSNVTPATLPSRVLVNSERIWEYQCIRNFQVSTYDIIYCVWVTFGKMLQGWVLSLKVFCAPFMHESFRKVKISCFWTWENIPILRCFQKQNINPEECFGMNCNAYCMVNSTVSYLCCCWIGWLIDDFQRGNEWATDMRNA